MVTDVLRLTPDLAIIPSAIAAVEVVPFSHSAGFYDRKGVVDAFDVRVLYLMAPQPVSVAWFSVGPRTFTGDVPSDLALKREWDELTDAAEARAHVVYEQIIQAIKESQ